AASASGCFRSMSGSAISFPSGRRRRSAPTSVSCGRRTVPSPCSWTTARSSAAGPEPKTGCTRAAGSCSSATPLRPSWRPAKFPEANRMHKKMLALSALCRARGDPPAARRAIGRAQCNDAYWHGVFGGLYLPHLRAAIWRNLALAEGELRRGEGLAVETLDLDADGAEELWIHSGVCSALVSPRRGGVIEEYTLFE